MPATKRRREDVGAAVAEGGQRQRKVPRRTKPADDDWAPSESDDESGAEDYESDDASDDDAASDSQSDDDDDLAWGSGSDDDGLDELDEDDLDSDDEDLQNDLSDEDLRMNARLSAHHVDAYAQFVHTWRDSGAAAAYRTEYGRHLADVVSMIVSSIGDGGSAAMLKRAALVRAEAEAGTLVVRRLSEGRAQRYHVLAKCGACGGGRKGCTDEMSLGGSIAKPGERLWQPVGTHCVRKVNALVALFGHVRQGAGGATGLQQCERLMGALHESVAEEDEWGIAV